MNNYAYTCPSCGKPHKPLNGEHARVVAHACCQHAEAMLAARMLVARNGEDAKQ